MTMAAGLSPLNHISFLVTETLSSTANTCRIHTAGFVIIARTLLTMKHRILSTASASALEACSS